MTSRTNRIFLYTCVCLVVRILLVYLVYSTKEKATYQNIAALISALIGLSFVWQYLYSKKELGFFGGKVWWKQLRVLHAFLFLLFAVLVLNGYKDACLVLIPGLVFGIIGFIQNYFFEAQ